MACECNCKLISRSCIIDFTPITTHIDENHISIAIDEAQSMYLEQLYGTCFETVCQQLKDNDNDVSLIDDKWQVLIKKSERTLAWYVYYEWIVLFGKNNVTNLGIRKKSIEDDEVTSTDDIKEAKGLAISKAEVYEDKFKRFLFESEEYDCEEDECDNKDPKYDDDELDLISIV